MFSARQILRSSRLARVGQPTGLRYGSTRASPRIGKGAITVAASALALSATAFAILNANDTQLHADAGSKASTSRISQIVPVVEPQALAKWEDAGVYAWGDNRGRVVAPDSDEKIIKQPTRLKCFEGKVLRDLKMNRDAGVAVLDNGDVVQWGVRYAPDVRLPEVTLKGKDIKQVELSEDTVIGLSNDGTVYTMSISRQDQALGHKPQESGWFGSTVSPISYRKLAPQLKSGERISSISAGRVHLLLVSTAGRAFSVAITTDFPEHGQLGVPGLTWRNRPPGNYDQCYEIPIPSNIRKAAAGYRHSLLLDDKGQVFAFGDNTSGQCGLDYSPETVIVQRPTPVQFTLQDAGPLRQSPAPVCRDISTGGNTSFFVVDVFDPNERIPSTEAVFSCGRGLSGTLGSRKWLHFQGHPAVVKDLSGLFEYDEKLNRTVPIRVSYLATGDAHCAAVLDNGAESNSSLLGSKSSEKYGSDVLIWGHNEYYQLGTGRRNNVNYPMHIQPLDWDRKVSPKESTVLDTIRFQVWPNAKMKTSGGKQVESEQKVYCGESVTAVYCRSRE